MNRFVWFVVVVVCLAGRVPTALAQDNPEVRKKEVEILNKEIDLQKKEIELLKREVGSEIKGILLRMRTENENLDRGTEVLATIKANGKFVAKNVSVAKGEFPESTDTADVTIPFDAPVPESTKFTIELVHPGIDGNSDPHWRMTYTVFAVQTNGKKRATTLRLSSAKRGVYETKGATAHLNFVGAKRSIGEMPFSVE
jgi:hypothetical protein